MTNSSATSDEKKTFQSVMKDRLQRQARGHRHDRDATTGEIRVADTENRVVRRPGDRVVALAVGTRSAVGGDEQH